MSNEIRKLRESVEYQIKQTDEIIASNEAIADRISEVNYHLASGFNVLGVGLQELCFIAEYGLQEVCDKLDLQNDTLRAIKKVLEKPLDTQAKELRKRAEFAYLNGWIDEAETDLLEAERKNYQDFIVHHILGNIYFFHKGNYEKALEFYQKAAKYAGPLSTKHAAEALLRSGMVYYKLGRFSHAYESTTKALELLPGDPHVLYHHARSAAKIGHIDEFLDCLRKSILKDPNYLITVDRDASLFYVKQEIIKLAETLRFEEGNAVANIVKRIDSAIEEAKIIGIGDFELLNNRISEVNKLIARNSYLDLLKAEEIARSAYEENLTEWLKAKNTFLGELKRKEAKIQSKGYAGLGCLPAVLVLIIAIVAVSSTYKQKVKRVGPVKVIVITHRGGPSFSDCWGGVKLGEFCYKQNEMVRVLDETPEIICILAKSKEEECFRRSDILALAKLDMGYFNEYSETYSIWLAVFGLVGSPIFVWVVSSIVIKRTKLSNIRSNIEKAENDIARLSNLKKYSPLSETLRNFGPINLKTRRTCGIQTS